MEYEWMEAVKTAKRGIYHTVDSCEYCEKNESHTPHGCIIYCGVCGQSHTDMDVAIGEEEGTVLRWILECGCGTTAFIKVN